MLSASLSMEMNPPLHRRSGKNVHRYKGHLQTHHIGLIESIVWRGGSAVKVRGKQEKQHSLGL